METIGDIYIKWMGDGKEELYLKDQLIFLHPTLENTGKLQDGRLVIKEGDRWIYFIG